MMHITSHIIGQRNSHGHYELQKRWRGAILSHIYEGNWYICEVLKTKI